MSKRYREVLEEVETPHSRAVDRAPARDEARDEARDDTVASGNHDQAGPGARPGVPEGPDGGGVATLVRPTAPSVVAGDGGAPADTPGTRAPRAGAPGTSGEEAALARRPRPGNGPDDAQEPLAFAWRGRRYEVTRILGHWREEEGWWRRPDGEPIRIEQSDLWRVEATRGTGTAAEAHGVYELARRGGTWRLDRVWD